MSPVPVTPPRKPCRKCLLQDLPDEKELSEILRERIAQLPEEDRTDPETYKARLGECRVCSSLNRGTCGECGCYVELRAARKKMTCPHVPPRWK